MTVQEDESRPVLEMPQLDGGYSKIWRVILSSLEQLLGRDTAEALCFHISKRSGLAAKALLIEDPERFRQTVISILQADVDPMLNRVAADLSKEFGINGGELSFAQVIEELKR